MKKQLYLLLALSLVYQTASAISHSFFAPRTLSTQSIYELTFIDYDIFSSESNRVFYTSIKPFGAQSTNRTALAQYFLPCEKPSIALEESGLGNVNPQWVQLSSAPGTLYSSRLALAPHRTAAGAIFTLYANLNCYIPSTWFAVNFAVLRATHKLGFCEYNQDFQGAFGYITNAAIAFNNPTWTGGKLPVQNMSRTGVDDIQFKLGYTLFENECRLFAPYFVATAPTGNRPNACYLFEPLVGTKHGSLGFGAFGYHRFAAREHYQWTIFGDINYRYSLKNRETRSFDLQPNGDWSRYLLVVTPETLLFPTPAINLLTMQATVRPRSSFELFLAARYERCAIQAEVGYDLWVRASQKVCPPCPPDLTNYGIFDLGGICNPVICTSNSATISQAVQGPNAALSDPAFVPLSLDRLNLSSGEHPRVSSSTIYGTVGWTLDWCAKPLVGFGASYEIPHKKQNGFQQWLLWANISLSY